jgi:hypothetical protein
LLPVCCRTTAALLYRLSEGIVNEGGNALLRLAAAGTTIRPG